MIGEAPLLPSTLVERVVDAVQTKTRLGCTGQWSVANPCGCSERANAEAAPRWQCNFQPVYEKFDVTLAPYRLGLTR